MCRSVCTNIVFGWGLGPRHAQPDSSYCHCHCHGLVSKIQWGNQRDGDRNRDGEIQGGCFTLFQDIIEPVWACIHAHTHVGTERTAPSPCLCSDLERSRDFPEYRLLGKKKAAIGFRFTFPAFSFTSSNYNNELWRSNETQTPGKISIMSRTHGRDGAAQWGRLIWVGLIQSPSPSLLNLVV